MKPSFQIFIYLFFAVPVCAQSLLQYQNFTIKKLSQADGLSQGSNYFLFEDKEGFMWITANDALNRYDGSWVKVYKDEKYFKNCPVLKQGYSFEEDKAGNIYVGSTIGLYKYNRSKDAFTVLKIFKNYADENCIPFAFRDNKIWCYNRFYAIAAIDVNTGKISLFSDVKTEPIASIHAYMFSKTYYRGRQPFFDKNGVIWLTSKSAIISYHFTEKKVDYYLQNDIAKRNLFFASSFYDSSKNAIIAGTNHGICLFDMKQHTATLIDQIQNRKLGVVQNLRKINKEFIWYSDTTENLQIVSQDFKSTYMLGSGNSSFETSVSDPVCIDRHNRLWYCKSGFGLTILDFNQPTFSKENGYKDDPYYFSKRGTHSFAEYPNGDLLINSGGKIFIKNHLNNEITELKQYASNALSTQLCNDYKRCGIWFLHNNKIVLLDCLTNQIVFSAECNENNYGIVQDILVLPSGNVWIAFSNGIYSIDFRNRKLIAVSNLQLPNAFKLNLINNQRVAISYLNGDMVLAKINSATTASIIGTILPGIKCFYLQQNTEQNIFWIGADDGVYLLDKNFKLLKKFNAQNGLSGSYIYGLLLDNANNVWVSHEKGISCINADNFHAVNYDEDDNIQDRDYNNRCFFKARSGTLYFGGIRGFNWFTPPVVPPSFYKPELYIDEIVINNLPLFADTNYAYVHDLNLKPQQNKISIHAVVKDLDMIHSNEVIYRFKNIDTLWQHLPSSSNIIFNNLAAGDYKLELGYYNLKQNIAVSQTLISISISSPFYKTIPFWILISAAITALLVWNYNKAKLKKQKRKYQQQISVMKERSRITADLHDDVGSALSNLQIHTVIVKQVMDADTKKAKEYLDKIIEQSSEISSNVSDIIWSMKPDKDRLIDIDGRIRNTVSNLLGATNIDYAMTIAPKLETIVKNITARKNIVLIIKEATNNCVKYSAAANYNLLIEADDHFLTITIADNGKGMSEEKTQPGNGLQNMHKRIEELKGTMQVETGNGKGTQLKFVAPLTEIRE